MSKMNNKFNNLEIIKTFHNKKDKKKNIIYNKIEEKNNFDKLNSIKYKMNNHSNKKIRKDLFKFQKLEIFLIIILSFFPCFSKKIWVEKLLSNYEITIIITVAETSPQKILNGNFPLPNEIYINENLQTEVKNTYNLTSAENQIKLIWNSMITTCESMFSDLNIVKANFSNFDFSQVTNMAYMFYNCKELTSIIFGNCDTSSVKYMNGMFHSCINLNPLDLSKFTTSSVIYMHDMFHGCFSLLSLDLRNFDTHSVKDMFRMNVLLES